MTQHFDWREKKHTSPKCAALTAQKYIKKDLCLEEPKESCKFVVELRTRTDLTACNLKKKC